MKVIKAKKHISKVLSVRVSAELLEALDKELARANRQVSKTMKEEGYSRVTRSDIISAILEARILNKEFRIDLS